MKISFMTFACPTYTFDQVVSLALRHGYGGIEFRCDSDHKHGVMVESGKAGGCWSGGLLPSNELAIR